MFGDVPLDVKTIICANRSYRILRIELDRVFERRGLRSREWAVEWDPAAIEFLLEKGFTAALGARPLKRAIEKYLLVPLALSIVGHEVPEGDQFLFVTLGEGALDVEFVDLGEESSGSLDAVEAHESVAEISVKGLAYQSSSGEEEIEGTFGTVPVLGDDLGTGRLDEMLDGDRGQDEVVELAKTDDEIRDEVDGRDHIDQRCRRKRLGAHGYPPVANDSPEQP